MERKGECEEEGGWKVVKRRREAPPRIGQNSTKLQKPRWPQGNKAEFRKHEDGITFFFNNFPEGTWLETLEKSFSKIGKVTDIYCPRKRDIKGKPFGFVRFQKGSDMVRVLEQLNNTWFGSYKLRAYIPRFERPKTEANLKNNRALETEGPLNKKERPEAKRTTQTNSKCMRVNGRTFAEVLGGTCNTSDSPVDEIIGFQTTEEETAWLQRSYTGYVKSEFRWDEFGEEINSESATFLKVSTIGGNLVLIQSLNNTPVQELLSELDEWSNFLFEWIRPWSYIDVNTQRITWIKWFGVPLQAWNSRFFEAARARMEMVLKIHEQTKSKERLDFALIQMSTGITTINRIFECKVDGAHFRIRVEEVEEQLIVGKTQTHVDQSESE